MTTPEGIQFQIDPFTAIALIGGWVYVVWIKVSEWRRTVKKRNKTIDSMLIMDGQIYKINNQILKKYRCLRVFLCQFSNGVIYASGQSKQNMTITHEVVADDDVVKKKSHAYDNQPISRMIHDIFSDVSKNGSVYQPQYNDIKDRSLKIEHDTYGVKTYLYLRVTDKKNNTVAMLVLHWNFNEPIGELQIAELRHTVMIIENIFAKYL